MSAPHSNPQILTLAPEILLAIVNCLPNFTDLHSVILAHRTFNTIWRTNEFAICGMIARNEFGRLWDDVYALLVIQNTANHHTILDNHIHILFDECYSELGNGVTEGGTKIGLQELFQIVPQYHQQLKIWRDSYIWFSMRCISRTGRRKNLGTIGIETLPISPDKRFRIDRAILRYWLLLSISAPEVTAYNDEHKWALKHHGGLLNAVPTMSHEDHDESSARRSRAVEPFLSSFSENEEELQELWQAASYFWSILPFPGGARIWGDQYYNNWPVVVRDMNQLMRWNGIHIKQAVFTRHLRDKRERRRDIYNAFTDFSAITGL